MVKPWGLQEKATNKNAHRVKVLRPRWKPSTEEYVIQVVVDGEPCPARYYYTPDRDDAEGTFRAMVAEARAQTQG